VALEAPVKEHAKLCPRLPPAALVLDLASALAFLGFFAFLAPAGKSHRPACAKRGREWARARATLGWPSVSPQPSQSRLHSVLQTRTVARAAPLSASSN